MCGITGLWNLDPHRWIAPALVQTMTTTLRHRGPDDEGYLFANPQTGALLLAGGATTDPALQLPAVQTLHGATGYNFAFGFRRLAILDLSPAGHQPMSTVDGRYWMVYNGEIYNYRELRTELGTLGCSFRSGTDTEVILNAYAMWGEGCLGRFNGMWAFALWDTVTQRLFCARDRFGVKPFYYLWDGARFAFASEIKALLHLPDVVWQPNDALIFDYLRYGRTDHTLETFFQQIHQLSPGHTLTVDATGHPAVRPFYTLDLDQPLLDITSEQAAARFSELFEDAVRLRLRSDVPVGTCLSGGLDSSSIVCVANRLLQHDQSDAARSMGERQKTFSSCYEDPRFDERQFIKTVLDQTGAEANYTFPSGEKLLEVLPRLVWHQDEPFGGLSIYAQWCVMELAAARGVTVLLDGQGGDELLAGYHPCFDYFWGGLLRRGQWTELGRELRAYQQQYGAPLPYLALRTVRPFAPVNLQGIARRWERGSLGIAPEFERFYSERTYEFIERGTDPLRGYLGQLIRYSIPMLLRFEDRNSMAHSIEARVPFLDYRLVEYAFSLPPEQKIHRATTKVVLRKAMQGVLPEAVRGRKDKMGFVAPERVWLANELRSWIEELVHSPSFNDRPYFDTTQIKQALADHVAGRRDLSKLAWRWLNLELWLQQLTTGTGGDNGYDSTSN
jgi:asparagine synthase (glutamine-hydrolysing)